MYKKLLINTIMTGIILFSCEMDPTSVDHDADVKLNGVFIINEGGFGHNNGSLSFYQAEDNSIQNGIFKEVNGRVLGDVVQSMTIIDTLGFIVVNNSNMIEVISINSWKSIKTIGMPAGSSPRYLADGNNGKAYVTNLYTNNVSVINLSNYEIESSISVGANPEEIVNSIIVGDNPSSIERDTKGVIHVLCMGRWGEWNNPDDPGTNGGIYSIDPLSLQVVDSLLLDGHPSKLCINDDNIGYFINGSSIMSFYTDTYEMVKDTLITGYYYGLALDPVSDKLFAMDAKDYAQNGSVSVFDLAGNLLNTFNVGIIPGDAAFVYEQD
jgi:YVTN family beta-propeller protein